MQSESRPDLRGAFDALDASRKRAIQLTLCYHALDVWEAFIQQHGPIEYVDSVVGLAHRVDEALPRDALRCVEAGRTTDNVDYRYQEPLSALQDDDLEFPSHVELAYYAVYNLYRSAVNGHTVDAWLIVNQALGAHDEPERWWMLLADALAERR